MTLSNALALDQSLRDVFSLRAAIPVLNAYLAPVQIDGDHPGFIFDWQMDNVSMFVTAANTMTPGPGAPWLRTKSPHMTVDEFLQRGLQAALPVVDGVERHLAVTYCLAEKRSQRSIPNGLPPAHYNARPLCQLFI
ncbi:hypothetical protein PHYSODRAFT_320126 [Phytophthora sojae]|uniref:Uncharacterized protein n=1 Tax=Phytophthora sojae (strain P6497) TaxID=1094619 RepID=G5AFX4_PHYSP|nr:hypothetical protein PHYSODRAFT_320126 [Phytophthora sojae]EGZ05490.1 hypothetical protein PHYSODRAFT_320126 [Phytophthora sojae]|eukprot:XP_009539021.1 hypothetical protein PHYSODRAFT_320126 [Phytophthora sojae]